VPDVPNTPATVDASDLFSALLAAEANLDYDALVVANLELFPDEEPFRIISTDNSFLLIRTVGGDMGSYSKLAESYVHPDDRDRLNEKLSSLNSLPGDVLGQFVNKLMEVSTARPTVPRSPSRGSRTTQS
jgi:hypothetical protein